jgi:hypothetical protein
LIQAKRIALNCLGDDNDDTKEVQAKLNSVQQEIHRLKPTVDSMLT